MEPLSSGTGFFITKNGIIATNYHVIENSKNISVIYNKKKYNAILLLNDKINDLALIKIEDKSFTNVEKLYYNFKVKNYEIGTSVMTLGFPLSSFLGENIKFADGKISGKYGIDNDVTNYQISVPIQPGNSGGPLFDFDGNLVGMTSSTFRRDLDITENVNYAIKINYINNLLENLDIKIELPKHDFSSDLKLTDKIKLLSSNVVLIKTYQ
jgi:S1-C subfamily serine protease